MKIKPTVCLTPLRHNNFSGDNVTSTSAVLVPLSLGPAMQKHLSAVSQMVAKIVATRADYEVTRQAVNRKNPGEDSDWDRKVEALR